MNEDQADYITDAKSMLGTGYDNQPSVEISPAQTVISRRAGKMVEEERAAFVKISTAFKAEMKSIDEVALKVWLYIALSVNRYTNEANPGLREIHNGTGLAVNTIRDAVDRLENKYELLVYKKGSGKSSNIYKPLAFVSAKRGVSTDDTQGSSVSVETPSVSVETPSVSASRQKNAQPENQINQIDSDVNKKIIEEANRTVGYILAQAGREKIKWTGREKILESLWPLADTFIGLTGLKPSKKDLFWWMGEWSTWYGKGSLPEDVKSAYDHSQRDPGGFLVSSPKSLTATIEGFRAKRVLKAIPKAEQIWVPPAKETYSSPPQDLRQRALDKINAAIS